MKHKLLKSALLGAAAVGVMAGAAKAHLANAELYFDFYGTQNINDMITIPCEASDYLVGKDYNLDPNVLSPMGNPTGVIIKYRPANQLNNADNIVIRLHNAKFGSNLTKCWLVFYENNGIDTDRDGVGDTSVDINRDGDHYDMIIVAETRGDVQGQEAVELNVGDAGRGIPANAIYYLWCAELGEPNLVDADGTMGSPQNPDNYTRYAPVINISADLYEPNSTDTCLPPQEAGKKVCLSADGFTCCGFNSRNPIAGYHAPEKCIIDTKCQFLLGMKSSLSIIDMYPRSLGTATCSNSKSGIIRCYEETYEPGTAFVPEGGNDDILTTSSCTDLHAADGRVTIYNDPDDLVDDDIILGPSTGWSAKFEASIYDKDGKYACSNVGAGGLPGYAALDFPGHNVYLDNNGDETSDSANNIEFVPGKACTLVANVENGDPATGTNTTIKIRTNSVWTDDVYMGVNGRDRLWWVRWGLEEKLKIYGPDNDLAFTVSLDEEEAANCAPDKCCYDADKVAYFKKWEPNGDEAYVPYMLDSNMFRIVVSNNSCWDAEIYARVWDNKGNVVDNIYLGKVGKNSVRILTGDYIASKARREHPNLLRRMAPLYSVILTVGAPKRDVEFAAYDNRNGKSKMIPVYDNGAHEWTYRNVEFYQDPFEK